MKLTRVSAPSLVGLTILMIVTVSPGTAQATETDDLRAQLQAALQRIAVLEQRVDALSRQPQPSIGASTVSNVPAEPVGQAPADLDRPPEVAVLGDQGAL